MVCPNLAISVSRQLPEQVPVDPQEVDLAPHPVVGILLQVGDTEKFPHALGFERLGPFLFLFFFFSESNKQGPCFTAVEDGGVKRLVQLEIACRLKQESVHQKSTSDSQFAEEQED